jgi:hypothetical protein
MTMARLGVEMGSTELTEWMAFDTYEAERIKREQKSGSAKPRTSRLGPSDDELDDN